MEFVYRIKGMHCQNCVDKIKTAFHPAVVEVTLKPPQLKLQTETLPSLEELNLKIAKAGDYQLEPLTNAAQTQTTKRWFQTYYPILLIAAFITAVSFATNTNHEGVNWHGWMNHFMAGFFLIFSAFKLLDLKGFADAYSTYDLLAARWHSYGFIYPFLETGLGFLYLMQLVATFTYIITIVLMGFSSLGVIKALLKKQTIRCACLGTILNVPMSSITLIEDLLMVLMAAIMLLKLF